MTSPGIYLVNSTGEMTPLLTEDGGGDHTLLEEVVTDGVAADTDLELVSVDYKLAHERSRPLVVNDTYGMDSATPLCKFTATKSAFSLGYGVIGANQREWERSVEINDPEAARELAAHLLEWADHTEENDD